MNVFASTLTERAFADRRRSEWEELDALTIKARTRGIKKLEPDDVIRLSPLYRSVCADLAAAQAARYSAPLVDYLLGLTAAAHTVVYGPHARGREDGRKGRLRRAWLVAFPRAVRRFKREMLLAAALFFIPFALGCVLTLRDPTFAFRVVPEAMLRPLTEAYAKGFGAGRDAVFIVGHGSLELGAIVLAGGAGLSLGWSLIAPGDVPRLVSLQRRAREILVIVAGASVMLFMAAAIEAFWSGSSAPQEVKLAVGSVLFLLVLAYVLFAGRDAEPTEERR
ncbi:MAG: hypothetical protein K0S65_25 [Labilithrix sp.]|nr:hypothetical protein [Labilithrix sp.]